MSSGECGRPCASCKQYGLEMSGVPCESCLIDWCMRCELNSPATYYTLMKKGEDPLDKPDVYVCEKCFKKGRWRKRWTDPEYLLAK
jgi:hypothetical protein